MSAGGGAGGAAATGNANMRVGTHLGGRTALMPFPAGALEPEDHRDDR